MLTFSSKLLVLAQYEYHAKKLGIDIILISKDI